ncbi:MAG: flagellin [Planctomycetaceae bacterium]|nr:flagellin [Planctomycetaceae bacterium]
MSRIGAVGLLTAGHLQVLRGLNAATDAVAATSQRLATLKQINSAADNPSGLVFAGRLQLQLDAMSAASNNVTRAQSLMATADAAAGDIVSQLTDARVLALEVAGGGLSAQDVADKQAELDAILTSIDRTARTDFNGTRLLDGTSGYRLSGVDTSDLRDVDVHSKTTTDDVTVSVNVTTTALQGARSFVGVILADTTLELDGPDGMATIELSSGATTYDIEDAFNAVSYLTGVTATRVNATTVTFATVEYGSDAEFTITPTAGTFTTTGTGTGRDAVATINGTSVTADGTVFSVASGQVSLTLEIDPAASGAIADFTVKGSGLQFQLSANASDVSRFGLANLTTSALGGSTGRLSSLASGQDNALTEGDALTAIEIIDEAFAETTSAQVRIGAYEAYTLDSAAAILDSQSENTTAALDDLMTVNVAVETARLVQQELWQQAALEALKVINLQSATVLGVLQASVARM